MCVPILKEKVLYFIYVEKKILSRENRCETKEYIFLLLWLMDDPWEIGISFVGIKGEIGEPRAGFWSPWSPDTMDISVKMATTVWFRGGNCYVLGSGGAGLVTDALAWKWKRKATQQCDRMLMRANVATSICVDAGPIWSQIRMAEV